MRFPTILCVVLGSFTAAVSAAPSSHSLALIINIESTDYSSCGKSCASDLPCRGECASCDPYLERCLAPGPDDAEVALGVFRV
ncbi:hypothetical protein B0H17DRAFT_1211335 [Mycena rosella]|uniref:Uncharacterized protein n=1 Tax=Mycena rosella TaxID=1033263 RepID=A0AAD7CUX4_MYCRO|nr:hypothetical protein B0H17DRAFT_1211335 [Mycena rosella]